MGLTKKIKIFKNFGFKVGMSNLIATNICIPSLRLHDRAVLNYLKSRYNHIIEKYKTNDFNLKDNKALTPPPIWLFWWQGEENMPEIVRACCASVRKYCGNHPVKIITEQNFKEYINLPDYVLEKVKSGKITFTHFSDFLRLYLLANYGGFWLDATILVTDKIPEDIFNLPYYTIKRNIDKNSRNVAMNRWTGFLWQAHAENILCCFVLDLLIEYWCENNMLIDYVLIDYAIALAYDEIPECRDLINSVPLNNPEIHSLAPILNSEFNPEIYKKLTSQTQFFKLTWKEKFKKLVNNHETFYGHIVDKYL